ncbi:hypothetical protein HMPREF1979_01706 [Actinomyces johnsonii F0542]|uniref:Uncharacterized protein n=1 Tax=Actinomyces johnsonii F0542 TaxID=1321818 RepID=U1Q768_9ACTO|nr:hypothetical protein HMPREF1979_01706 [Actinomyces johnsonii F0542]
MGAVELIAQGPDRTGDAAGCVHRPGAAGRFTGDFSQAGHGAGSRSWFFTVLHCSWPDRRQGGSASMVRGIRATRLTRR